MKYFYFNIGHVLEDVLVVVLGRDLFARGLDVGNDHIV